eukprot:GHVU01148740.1.p1 GENE.GHVU01148740.1~~GHVU01148740.1.p1  ORF type:complete len:355 (+),score=26.69 GHVU01148740.1:31-1065(+)
MSDSWHTSQDVLRSLEEFQRRYARFHPDLQSTKQTHNAIITEIRDYIKSQECELKIKRLEFVGSAYGGVQIDDGEIEFDVLIILDGSGLHAESTVLDGYFLLEQSTALEAQSYNRPRYDPYGKISAQKMSDAFRGDLQRCLNKLPHLENRIKLIQHGTVATQMYVYKEGHPCYGKPWYKVDMVPCIEIGANRFVAKPLNDDSVVPNVPDVSSIWRQSFSVEEKELFSSLDGGDNGTRKVILRILKAMRKKDATLQGLTSYHLKTALILENRSSPSSWNPGNLVPKMMAVMKRLEDSLANGYLPNAFCQGINLLKSISPATRNNIQMRLKGLRNSQVRFEAIIKG